MELKGKVNECKPGRRFYFVKVCIRCEARAFIFTEATLTSGTKGHINTP